MKTELLSVSDQLLTAVLNGTYQGIILVVLVAVTLRLLRRNTNAATRHGIWLATLVLLVLIIPAHCLRGYLSLAQKEKTPDGEMAAEGMVVEEFEIDLSDALAENDRTDVGASSLLTRSLVLE